MELKEHLNKIPDSFYECLCGSLLDGEFHTDTMLNLMLREVDKYLEKVLDMKFPVSVKVTENCGEVFYSNIVKQKVYREHIIEVKKRLIECRKRVIEGASKFEVYDYLYKTLYLVYKDLSEEKEGLESEEYIRVEDRRSEIIEYFNNNKL